MKGKGSLTPSVTSLILTSLRSTRESSSNCGPSCRGLETPARRLSADVKDYLAATFSYIRTVFICRPTEQLPVAYGKCSSVDIQSSFLWPTESVHL